MLNNVMHVLSVVIQSSFSRRKNKVLKRLHVWVESVYVKSDLIQIYRIPK